MAKSGQMEAVKIMAKDLVRTRNFVKKFILMKANIQAIALKVQTLRSQAAMANAMKGILEQDQTRIRMIAQFTVLIMLHVLLANTDHSWLTAYCEAGC